MPEVAKWHVVLFEGVLLIYNKSYYYINVVCIQTVPQWGSYRECGINRGNTICT